MHISIQSLEITYNAVPYRFIVKQVANTSRNEISFHCWAPDDSRPAKELMNSSVLMFEWDHHNDVLVSEAESPLVNTLKEAIRQTFMMERA